MSQSTEKSLGRIAHETGERVGGWARRWSDMGPGQREDWEQIAQAVAAAVREQAVLEAAMQSNRADLLAEDIEALHMCLDHRKVPREDDAGAIYSMWGRVLRLVDATREQYAQACEEAWYVDGSATAKEFAGIIRSMK